MRESALHQAIVQYLTLALPPDAIFHHSPNEGRRGFNEQRWIKSSGTRKGWPDLEIIYGGELVFLELKAPKKYCSPEQRECHKAIKAAGCEVFVVHSIAEAQMALELCGIPCSARVAA